MESVESPLRLPHSRFTIEPRTDRSRGPLLMGVGAYRQADRAGRVGACSLTFADYEVLSAPGGRAMGAATLENQRKMIANRGKILANQKQILANQKVILFRLR